MKFDIGDTVVHPQHGVGFVADVEEKQFEPESTQTYYVISIPETTLWVPVDYQASGLRKLGTKPDLEECRQVLVSAPQALKAGRDLQSSLAGYIRQGTIIAQSEVVRDLTAYGWSKSLFGPLSDFRRTTYDVLCQEWAAVEGIPQLDASNEIGLLLKKCRTSYEH